MDPLMAAITDEEAAEKLRADPAYRAAVTDVALLREELHRLGDTLGQPPEPAHRPAPAPAPAAGRGRRRAVLFGLAASCAGALLGGVVWVAAQGGLGGGSAQEATSASEDKAASMSAEGAVACARLIVEGEVVRAEALPGTDRDRITLDVTRSYKPVKTEPRVTFVMDRDVHPRLSPGDHTLIIIDRGDPHPTHWSTGEDMVRARAWIERALPGAEHLTCDPDTVGPGV